MQLTIAASFFWQIAIGLVLFSYMYSSLSSAILIITNYISRRYILLF